jgi:hypothetical protein
VAAVHGHAVDLAERQCALELLLGLGELAAAGQRPAQGQPDDPAQRLGADRSSVGDLCRARARASAVGPSSWSPAISDSTASAVMTA